MYVAYGTLQVKLRDNADVCRVNFHPQTRSVGFVEEEGNKSHDTRLRLHWLNLDIANINLDIANINLDIANVNLDIANVNLDIANVNPGYC